MQNLEALMLNFLDSVTLNVFLQEGESRLVGLDGVVQVVLGDGLVLPQEGSNSFDATSRLQVLRVYHLVDVLIKFHNRRIFVQFHGLKNPHEHCFESLEIPVLVNDLVDHSSLEDLMDL